MKEGAQSLDIEPEACEALARLSRVKWAGEAATGGEVHSDDESETGGTYRVRGGRKQLARTTPR